MQTTDNILPAPKTCLEAWSRWMNAMETKFKTAPWAGAVKIEVKHPCPGWNGRACDTPIALGAYMCRECMPEEDED